MTDELTKTFFDTFGIQAKPIYSGSKLYNPFVTGYDYPQITDRILLELICIWNLYCTDTLIPTDYKNVKEYVLRHFVHIDTYKLIVDAPIVKRQVRTLFEEW